MTHLVIDASLVAKWYLRDEQDAGAADSILGGLCAEEIVLCAPLLLLYEVGNILFVASSLRNRLTKISAKKVLANLQKLPINYQEPDFNKVISLTLKHNISFYDGAYLQLAKGLDIPFITGDNRLCNKLKGQEKNIFPLNEYRP
ncbi:type II toxin-antitoxin system VapC family toxin [Patescibacteria group bacterium]|nr:type II toxin-antitoxin system VapC family toxin [Patescibacteria group bacterium]